ncbi:hypothetical protein EB796_024133 [Bugula neritina]|uniref:DUF753 domain-containing protein n=1 Tax=Bugula neritina TaxID=10212 RepID=A0A7J7IUF5_BUGNE|nr:hypothetical protein EB796_024133 [Bugula neritina]
MELMVTVSCLGLLTHWMTLVAAAGSEVTCYSCSSELDDSCIDNPTSTTSCSLTHGKGCATKLATNGAVVRGCSDIGLTPQGCQVSIVFGTECVCHTDRCNVGIPADKAAIEKHVQQKQTIDCYECSSMTDTSCTYTIHSDSNINVKTCPAVNGCYFMKRLDSEGVTIYNRLCFEDQGPATYYPSGCYTVFKDQSLSSSEVCVCYYDKCNKDSITALKPIENNSKVEKQVREDNSSSQHLSTTWLTYVWILSVITLYVT